MIKVQAAFLLQIAIYGNQNPLWVAITKPEMNCDLQRQQHSYEDCNPVLNFPEKIPFITAGLTSE